MQLIDSHCHIYLPEFDDDRHTVLDRASAAGVGLILMPAIDASTHEKMMQTAREYPICHSMIGLHPCSVTPDFEKEIALIENYLAGQKFFAIGEIGLDFYWDKTFTEQQYAAFRLQIQIAMNQKLPIVIHSRNAIDECIAVVREYPGVHGVFHCFSGSAEQAKQVIDAGLYLGIGGVVTFKNGGLDKVLPEVGLSNVVLETDAPYLAPVPYRGKRNEPAYVRLVAEKIAGLLQMDLEEVAKITSENSRKLFALS